MTSKRKRGFILFSKIAALFAFSISSIVLIGWLFDIVTLKSIQPHWVSMKVNSAVAFTAASALLFYKTGRQNSGRKAVILKIGSFLIFLLGALTLSQYLFHFDLGIDQILIIDQNAVGTYSPGRMAPFTAINFILLGAGLFFYDSVNTFKYRLSDYLSLCILVLCIIPLLGYLFDLQFLYNLTNLTQVALHTAAIFVLLSLGMLFGKSESGIISLFTQNANVSKIVFKQLISIVIISFLVSWLRFEGQNAGYYNTEFGIFIVAFVYALVVVIILVYGAKAMLKSELHLQALKKATEENLLIFQSVLESAPAGIVGSNKNGTILFASKEVEVLFGYSKNELIGASVELLIPAEYASGHVGLRNSYYENPITRKGGKSLDPLVAKAKNGSEFSVEIGLSSCPTKDGLLIISFIRDVTELQEYHKHLELLVYKRTRDLDAALLEQKELLSMKSKFVSIVSHEFRVPLSTIGLDTDFIVKYQGQISSEKVLKKLKSIEKQVAHMAQLLDNVLMMGKVGNPKIEIGLKSVKIGFLKKLAQGVLTSTGARHKLIYSQQFSDRSILTSEHLIRNIIINLITNAVKFSPNANEIYMSVTFDTNWLYIKIKDFGIGIPPLELANLFEPFSRGSNVSNIAGTGLGLSIAKKAIELLDGMISVNSKVNKGTEFTITLPLVYT